MRQVKFYIDEERYEELKKLAQEQGLTVPGYVKRLVLKHLGEIEGGRRGESGVSASEAGTNEKRARKDRPRPHQAAEAGGVP